MKETSVPRGLIFLILLVSVFTFITPAKSQALPQIKYRELLQLGRGTIRSVAWHPKDELVAVGGGLGIWLYTTDFSEFTQLDQHTGEVTDVDWNDDGTALASSSTDGTIRIWDYQTLESVLMLDDPTEQRPDFVEWSPTGKQLLAKYIGHAVDFVDIWDIETGEILQTLTPDDLLARISSIEWNGDGTQILTVADGKIQIWGAENGQVLKVIEIDNAKLAAWSPNNEWIAISDYQSGLHIWNLLTNESSSVLASECPIGSFQWNTTSTKIISVDFCGNVYESDAQAYHSSLISTNEGNSRSYHIFSWSPDSRYVVAADVGQGEIWNAGTGESMVFLAEHLPPASEVVWSPDESELVAAFWAEPYIKMWDFPTGNLKTTISTDFQGVQNLTWSSDGNFLANTYDGNQVVDLWKISENTIAHHDRLSYPSTLYSISWNSASNLLSGVGLGGAIVNWDATNDFLASSVGSETSNIEFLSWNPNGTWLGTATWDGKIEIWDTGSYELYKSLKTDGDITISSTPFVTWHPASERLAGISRHMDAGILSYFVWIWNIASDELSVFSEIFYEDRIAAMAWSLDGKYLAITGGSRVDILDGDTGQLYTSITAFHEAVNSVAWNSSGSLLATASLEGTVRVWEIE